VNEAEPLVELLQVSRSYGDLEVLHPTSLSVAAGDYLAITGPSGSGKTTLLQLIGLLDRPSSGTYRFAGVDVSELDDGAHAALRSRNFGFVFQAFHLIGARTAAENVELGMLYQGLGLAERRRRAGEALARVGLSHRSHARASTLSGGEKQRAAIARALAGGTSVILADEPTGNLDSANGEVILELFADLHHDGLTIAVITHDEAVASRASKVLHLHDGTLQAAPP
jgi:putative ABC transport system ATP-binding protein